MSLEFLAVLVFIFVLASLYVLLPWLEPKSQNMSSKARDFLDRYQQEIQNREILIENLKDLELDYRTGKINSEDYEGLRKKMLQQAVEATEKIKLMESQQNIFSWIQHQTGEISKDASA